MPCMLLLSENIVLEYTFVLRRLYFRQIGPLVNDIFFTRTILTPHSQFFWWNLDSLIPWMNICHYIWHWAGPHWVGLPKKFGFYRNWISSVICNSNHVTPWDPICVLFFIEVCLHVSPCLDPICVFSVERLVSNCIAAFSSSLTFICGFCWLISNTN